MAILGGYWTLITWNFNWI